MRDAREARSGAHQEHATGHHSKPVESSAGPGLFPMLMQSALQIPALLAPGAMQMFTKRCHDPREPLHGHCPTKGWAQLDQASLQAQSKGLFDLPMPRAAPSSPQTRSQLSSLAQTISRNSHCFAMPGDSLTSTTHPGEVCKLCEPSTGGTHHFCPLPNPSF